MSIFNTIISALDFLILKMPGYDPSFWVGFGWNTLGIVTMIFVILYAHKCNYFCKNHLTIVLQIPLTLSIPILANYLQLTSSRFYAYVLNMMVLGCINALQLTAIYGQASQYPNETAMSALNFGMGLSGVFMNFARIIVIYIG